MGSYSAKSSVALQRGKNQRCHKIRSCMDDPRARGIAKLGQSGDTHFTNAQKKSISRYDKSVYEIGYG